MKKSAIFKILTLFLTFIIFSCCSGCFVESCIGSCMDKQEAKEKTKFIEQARAKKAKADSFVPQVDDYILELKLNTCFKNGEEAYNEGFFDLFDPRPRIFDYDLICSYNPKEKTFNLFALKPSDYPNYEYKLKCNTTDIYGYEFFFIPNGPLFLSVLIEYDGNFFAVQETESSYLYRTGRLVPPALYMIDFKNEQILYCGYFEQWYDDVFNNYNGSSSWDYYYKITKK